MVSRESNSEDFQLRNLRPKILDEDGFVSASGHHPLSVELDADHVTLVRTKKARNLFLNFEFKAGLS